MTSTHGSHEQTEGRSLDKAQFIVSAVSAAVGIFLIVDALSLTDGYTKTDPVGPRAFPITVGVGLILLAVGLGIAILRGSKGEADAGEDIDPDSPSDWKTVGLLIALFVALIMLVMPLGWAIAGALFFAGSATVLGSKHYVRNLVIGTVLAVGTFYAFYGGLGIPLPAGLLDGIL